MFNADDEEKRPNWREIDSRRNRSQHRREAYDQDAPAAREIRRPHDVERYKRNLEALFSGSGNKPTPEQAKQLRKIEAARGPEIDRECASYLANFGLPNDWESLTIFLDASDSAILDSILGRMAELCDKQTPSAQTTFKQRLRVLKLTTAHKKIRELADQISTSIP